jgi:hypothetical protein
MQRAYLTASAALRCRQAHSADELEVRRRNEVRRPAAACKPEESVMTKLENRCSNCGGKFGLVCYHHWGLRFCRKACKDNFLAKTAKDYACMRRWLGLLPRGALLGDEPALAVDAAKRGLTAATINPRSWLLRATSISPTGNPPARGKETGTLRLRAKS